MNPHAYGQAVNGQVKQDLIGQLADVFVEELASVDQDFLSEYLTEGYGASYTPTEMEDKFSADQVKLINVHRVAHMKAFVSLVMTSPVALAFLGKLGYYDDDLNYLVQSGTLFDEVSKVAVHGA